jgi:MoaA/NifB/PqqE/SkfB family radical SAM enzyme
MAGFALRSANAAKLRVKSEKEGLHIPPFLIASITTQCNLRCRGCYDRANRERCACEAATGAPQSMSADRWSDVFRQAAEIGVSFILLAGGEPFLRCDVLEAAGRFPQILFPVSINGTLMDADHMLLLERRRNLIPIISIEGRRETTDARRGEGVYELLQETMRALDRNGLLYGVSITVTKQNLHEVLSDNYIGGLADLGCKALIFVEYVPVDGKSSDLAPDDEARADMERLIDGARRNRPDILMLSFPGDEKNAGGCLAAGRGFFHINAYGGAEPCPFSPYSDVSLVGTSLLDVLRSPLFQKLRDSGGLMAGHTGGCALFERDDQVRKLFAGSL